INRNANNPNFNYVDWYHQGDTQTFLDAIMELEPRAYEIDNLAPEYNLNKDWLNNAWDDYRNSLEIVMSDDFFRLYNTDPNFRVAVDAVTQGWGESYRLNSVIEFIRNYP